MIIVHENYAVELSISHNALERLSDDNIKKLDEYLSRLYELCESFNINLWGGEGVELVFNDNKHVVVTCLVMDFERKLIEVAVVR